MDGPAAVAAAAMARRSREGAPSGGGEGGGGGGDRRDAAAAAAASASVTPSAKGKTTMPAARRWPTGQRGTMGTGGANRWDWYTARVSPAVRPRRVRAADMRKKGGGGEMATLANVPGVGGGST